MARKSDVKIKDMGYKKAIDRLTSLDRAMVTVGVLRPKRVAKYAAIWEHRLGWKTRADVRLAPQLDVMFARIQRRVVAGGESFKTILGDFGDDVATGQRDEILGKYGLVSPTGEPGLVDTGDMARSINKRLRVPK